MHSLCRETGLPVRAGHSKKRGDRKYRVENRILEKVCRFESVEDVRFNEQIAGGLSERREKIEKRKKRGDGKSLGGRGNANVESKEPGAGWPHLRKIVEKARKNAPLTVS